MGKDGNGKDRGGGDNAGGVGTSRVDGLIRGLKTFEALARLTHNEDFGVFLDELRAAHGVLQAQHNDCDLTKPIPAARIQGGLNALETLLRQLDTSETTVRHLRHNLEEGRSKPVSGGGSRHPVAEALPPVIPGE